MEQIPGRKRKAVGFTVERTMRIPDRLDKYKEFYTQDLDYWYVPKRLTVKKENWGTLREALAVFKELENENFTECEALIGEQFRTRGIDVPYEGAVHDAANARMMKQPLEQLGLLYVSISGDTEITEVGEEFLRSEQEDDWQKLIEKQLHKWQFANPTIGRHTATDTSQMRLFGGGLARSSGGRAVLTRGFSQHSTIALFPYRFLIKVLLGLQDHRVSTKEYVLFVVRAKKENDLNTVIGLIKEFRELPSVGKGAFTEDLKSSPFKDLEYRGRPLYMYGRIMRNAPYSRSFLSNGMLVECTDNAYIQLMQPDTAFRCVADDSKYIEYLNDEDWMLNYGSLEQAPSFLAAVRYYEDVGEYSKAAEVVRVVDEEITDRELKDKVKKEIREYFGVENEKSAIEILLEEKDIEDYFERNVRKVSRDLELLDYNGNHRQVDLPLTGWNVDLLAKDPNGNIVVIELKRRKGDDAAIGQILRYMGWFVEHEVSTGNYAGVRGVIIANEETEKLRYAIKGIDYAKKDYVVFRQFTIAQQQ
ncbi:DUF91 domain-containing protein [candidate division TA06 bacterium]|uniref:DUF91 domain-containing protein n=1 Tax=candidate division TA06 bacterium TaxID=2250710 RepID=A0A523UP19_UNCT6|nr:MAG: DUF91 domain-containing protein [candidate division TA06 bacterium]